MKYVVLDIWFNIPVPSRYSIVLLLLLVVTVMLPLSLFSSMTGLVEYHCCATTHVISDCQVRVFSKPIKCSCKPGYNEQLATVIPSL